MALRWSLSGVVAPFNTATSTATRKSHSPPPLPLLLRRSCWPSAFPAPLRERRSHPPPLSPPSATALPLALPLPLPLLDPRLISTSISASLNLISLCGFVILMQKYGYLPSNTAQVLSQVSFNLVIPCFLMSKLSKTISLQQDWRLLALPLIALIQITVGVLLGRLACLFLYRRSSVYLPEGGNNGLLAKEAVITTACAFGNPITLPLVFLNGMLSQFDYSAAAGYLALFMVGWSPCLWTLGYQILNSTSEPLQQGPNKNSEFSLDKLFNWLKKLMNPPLFGVFMGFLVGATPLSYLCLPAKHMFDTERTQGFLFSIGPFMARILQPILEGANLLGSATVPLQAIVLASTLASSISHNEDNDKRFAARIDGTTPSLHKNFTASDTMLEGKAFWAITVIRLLVMPLISFTLLIGFQHQRWLLADPLSRLVLLVVAAMPTGQNLVVLAQLHPNTRSFTGVLANVVVRQYLLAVVSLTFWLPIFFSFLQLH